MTRPFGIIVAMDSNRGIGHAGTLAWHLPADLKEFKRISSSVKSPIKQNAVIMGRKTWDSLPAKFKPLPGRLNVVLSRSKENFPGALSCVGLDEALGKLDQSPYAQQIEAVFVIGGAQIYNQAISHPQCASLYITKVSGNYDCDAFFPPYENSYHLVQSSPELIEGNIQYSFTHWVKN